MADYIDRQAAVDMFQRMAYDDWNQGVCTTWANAFSEAADMIEDLPSADAVEVRHGRWIDKSGGIEGAWNYCSVCGEKAIDLYDFCPNCGARMDGEKNG